MSGKMTWPQRRAWKPTPVSLPRESHGQMSLAGNGPQVWKELDMTEATYHALAQSDMTETDTVLFKGYCFNNKCLFQASGKFRKMPLNSWFPHRKSQVSNGAIKQTAIPTWRESIQGQK